MSDYDYHDDGDGSIYTTLEEVLSTFERSIDEVIKSDRNVIAGFYHLALTKFVNVVHEHFEPNVSPALMNLDSDVYQLCLQKNSDFYFWSCFSAAIQAVGIPTMSVYTTPETNKKNAEEYLERLLNQTNYMIFGEDFYSGGPLINECISPEQVQENILKIYDNISRLCAPIFTSN